MVVTKKVALLGDSSVGKTSLIKRFVKDIFDDSYIVTIGSKVTKKQLTVKKKDVDEKVTLMIWDVIGTEGYTSLHARTFAGVHGAIMVADYTRRETLNNIETYWIPNLLMVVENVPIVFACNKSDLKDQYAFQLDDMKAIASRHNEDYTDALPPEHSTCYATSAKAGDNVNELFESLAHMMLSEKIVADPTKELYESMLATSFSRMADRSTLLGAFDAIIVDFAEGLNDEKKAMSIISKEVKKLNIDVKSPTKEELIKLINNLRKAESKLLDKKKIEANKEKRMQWAQNAK